MSSQLSADQVADLLREWYADCHAILRHYGASIDKFIGDCVFAYWHGTEPDIRARALHAAQALRAVEVEPTSPDADAAEGASRTSCSTAASACMSATVAIGAMGKGINTALGDAVNIAFGIEGLTRTVDQPALVSAAFLDGWDQGRHHFESCGFHEVKGRSRADRGLRAAGGPAKPVHPI